MEYSRAEKIIYWWRYKNYFMNKPEKYQYSDTEKNSILIVLPDGEVAFNLANLFLEKIQYNDAKIHFLIKDALINFYPKKINESAILFSYKDINSLGLPTQAFVEKIKEYWPEILNEELYEDYVGIRPKIQLNSGVFADFSILTKNKGSKSSYGYQFRQLKHWQSSETELKG